MAGTRGRKGSRQRAAPEVKAPSAEELQQQFLAMLTQWIAKIEAAVKGLKPSEADFASVATSVRAFQPAMLLARELTRAPGQAVPASGAAEETPATESPATVDPAAELRGLKLRTG